MNELNVYKFINENSMQIDSELVVNKLSKIYIFQEFETGILTLFDGYLNLKEISMVLKNKYNETYNEKEFMEFVEDMVGRGLLVQIS